MNFRQPNESDNPLSSEKDKLHQEGMAKMRAALDEGKTFAEAEVFLNGMGGELRALIADDLLKIIMAEEHFIKGRSIGEMAQTLGLTYEKVAAVREAMLDEVGTELARQYRREIQRQSH